jgi:hypothetical protein
MRPRVTAHPDAKYGIRAHGLSQSVPTRIVANPTIERQLLFDINS